MSSLHQDHLPVEGSEPVRGTGSTLTTVRGTSRKPVEERATNTVPTQRQEKPQRTGSAQTTTDISAPASRTRRTVGGTVAAAAAGTIAARAKAAGAATGKVASAKAATAKAATVKVASAKAATAKAATVRAVTGARSAAAAKAGTRSAGTPSVTAVSASARPTAAAKPAVSEASATSAAAQATTVQAAAKAAASKTTAAAKPAASKTTAAAKPAASMTTAAAKAAASKPAVATATAQKPAAVQPAAVTPAAAKAAATAPVRPTPFKRTADAVVPPVAAVVESAPASLPQAEVEPADVVASVADDAGSRSLRRPQSLTRRPAFGMAAALVGVLSVSAFSAGDPSAQATSKVSHSVTVAHALGIESAPAEEITAVDATQRLGELAVSRNVRGAEQAAAAQTQAAADQAAAAAAAEAARPKAVLPVSGARLTSGFGGRWGTLHAGIDLAAPMQTPEYAAVDGVVLEAGPASGYGLAVYIQHENGDVTVYGHMDTILVQAGQVVRAGDTIALLGNRGQSTGPHLHFEVHVGGMNGQKIDPLPWLRERGVAI
jgi:murein DD-endopeptidase MepM/ murein hydrolase activator NlpD